MESVRQSFMKFALSFLIVGDAPVISAILELKGLAHHDYVKVIIVMASVSAHVAFLSNFFKLLPKDDLATAHLFLRTFLEKVSLLWSSSL